MNAYKMTVVFKRKDGSKKAKAMYTVYADTLEQAKKKLAENLTNLEPYEIVEVKHP